MPNITKEMLFELYEQWSRSQLTIILKNELTFHFRSTVLLKVTSGGELDLFISFFNMVTILISITLLV